MVVRTPSPSAGCRTPHAARADRAAERGIDDSFGGSSALQQAANLVRGPTPDSVRNVLAARRIIRPALEVRDLALRSRRGSLPEFLPTLVVLICA
jgi:hypothetical protein